MNFKRAMRMELKVSLQPNAFKIRREQRCGKRYGSEISFSSNTYLIVHYEKRSDWVNIDIMINVKVKCCTDRCCLLF